MLRGIPYLTCDGHCLVGRAQPREPLLTECLEVVDLGTRTELAEPRSRRNTGRFVDRLGGLGPHAAAGYGRRAWDDVRMYHPSSGPADPVQNNPNVVDARPSPGLFSGRRVSS